MNDNILDEIYEKLENAQRYRDYIAAECLFHNDSRPSLMIYPDYYRCLSCGAKGKTEKLLEKLGNTFVPKTKVDHSNPFTKWTKKNKLSRALQIAHYNIKQNSSLGSYLIERGIPIETQMKLGLGYMDDWYTFPIWSENNCIAGAIARRNTTNLHPAKYIIPSGQDPNLLYVPDWGKIKESRIIFLTFGILDAISIYLCGYASISTTAGKRLNPDTLESFRKKIVFFPDKDEEFEALDISRELGWRGKVYQCNYTFDAKDPNDLYLRQPEDFKLMLRDIVRNL